MMHTLLLFSNQCNMLENIVQLVRTEWHSSTQCLYLLSLSLKIGWISIFLAPLVFSTVHVYNLAFLLLLQYSNTVHEYAFTCLLQYFILYVCTLLPGYCSFAWILFYSINIRVYTHAQLLQYSLLYRYTLVQILIRCTIIWLLEYSLPYRQVYY